MFDSTTTYQTDRTSLYPYFLTCTYSRDLTASKTWKRSFRDTSEFFYKLRRSPWCDKLEYARAFEYHKDGYPHIHAMFIINRCYYSGNKFIFEPYRGFIKSLWNHGLVDIQSPRVKGLGILNYALKYVSKGGGASYLWTRILHGYCDPFTNVHDDQLYVPKYSHWWYEPVCTDTNMLRSKIKYRKHKLLTWSRSFVPVLREYLFQTDDMFRKRCA